MAFRRIATAGILRGLEVCRAPHRQTKFTVIMMAVQTRFISSLEVTKNIQLLSEEKKSTKVINLKLEKPEDKPLVVMLSWLMAKKKHVYKYAEIYLKNGFDVLNVNISPWQLLWPMKGSQVVAKDLVRFLDLNKTYSPLLLHGFSVGGYFWGEVLVHIAAEGGRYNHVVDRITGQIWDSAADVTEIPFGLPAAVFPKNKVLQNALRQYLTYHMRTFDKVATRHYIRSSQMFHLNLVKAPALFLISKSDPIGAEVSNQRVRESWENMGIQVTWKCWDRSPHVGHFRVHRKEYMEMLMNFLESVKAVDLKNVQQVRAKL